MFSKISRYRKLEDVVVPDRTGALTASRSLRLIPRVEGEFLHTVEEHDRLDHLAYKYYRQPRKWWRISDANPDYPFPPAVLGKGTTVIQHFPLIINAEEDEPFWADVLAGLDAMVGVEHAQVVKEELSLVERAETVGTETATVLVPRYGYQVIVRYNGMNLDLAQLVDRLADLGLTLGPHERIGRVGKTLVIPPNTVA
jgi:hypothetical protein